MKTFNATIESTQLGQSDRGVTFFLNLSWPGAGQGFGGINLRNVKVGALVHLLNAVGVSYWEQLKGKTIRVEEPSTFNGNLKRIGHIVEDKWFDLETDLTNP